MHVDRLVIFPFTLLHAARLGRPKTTVPAVKRALVHTLCICCCSQIRKRMLRVRFRLHALVHDGGPEGITHPDDYVRLFSFLYALNKFLDRATKVSDGQFKYSIFYLVRCRV